MVQISDLEKTKLWEERIDDFLSSGLTQKAWCEEKGIPGHQLGYRLRKYKSKDVKQPTNRWVNLPTSHVIGSGVSLKLGKVVLEVEPGFDEQTFSSVLRALMAAC